MHRPWISEMLLIPLKMLPTTIDCYRWLSGLASSLVNLRCFPHVGIDEEMRLVPQKQHETSYQTTKVTKMAQRPSSDMGVRRIWGKWLLIHRQPTYGIVPDAWTSKLTSLEVHAWCFVSSREIFLSCSSCEQLVQVQFYWGTGSGEIEGVMFLYKLETDWESSTANTLFFYRKH